MWWEILTVDLEIFNIVTIESLCRIFDNIIANKLSNFARVNHKNLFVSLVDYEKAFDYTNRMQIICELMPRGCSSQFTLSIARMYLLTEYLPQLSGNKLGNSIKSKYGVTKGRGSSANLYSLYVLDMPESMSNLGTTDFMDPLNLAQIADDTMIIVEYLKSMKKKLTVIFT